MDQKTNEFIVGTVFDSMRKVAELTAALEQQKEREGKLVQALQYCLKACQCERFPQRKTKRGFEYGEVHPVLGKCEAGSRWLTPEAKAEATLKELGIL